VQKEDDAQRTPVKCVACGRIFLKILLLTAQKKPLAGVCPKCQEANRTLPLLTAR